MKKGFCSDSLSIEGVIDLLRASGQLDERKLKRFRRWQLLRKLGWAVLLLTPVSFYSGQGKVIEVVFAAWLMVGSMFLWSCIFYRKDNFLKCNRYVYVMAEVLDKQVYRYGNAMCSWAVTYCYEFEGKRYGEFYGEFQQTEDKNPEFYQENRLKIMIDPDCPDIALPLGARIIDIWNVRKEGVC